MSVFPRAVLARVLLRSFAIQGSWNFRSLLGSGFAYALLPVLRFLYRDRPAELRAAVLRHTELFNCHPYLSPLALGAVAVMEEGEPPQLVSRFKAAVRGSLGTLGDRLIWAGWRPICALLGVIMVALRAPWWLAVATYLLVYNAGHVGLRIWSFKLGLTHGKHVGEELRTSQLHNVQNVLQQAGAGLAGVLLPIVIARPLLTGWQGVAWIALLIGAVVLGLVFGGRVRTPVAIALATATVAALVVSAL